MPTCIQATFSSNQVWLNLSACRRLAPAACLMCDPMRGPRWWGAWLWVRARVRRAGFPTGAWEPALFSQTHATKTQADAHTATCAGAAERGRSPRIVLVDAGMVAQLSSSEQVGHARGSRSVKRGVSCAAAHTSLLPRPVSRARVLFTRDRTKDFSCTDAHLRTRSRRRCGDWRGVVARDMHACTCVVAHSVFPGVPVLFFRFSSVGVRAACDNA